MHTIIQLRKNYGLLILFFLFPAAVIFPILVHLIPPVNGIPIGAILLPMFYIPLLVLLMYGRGAALLTACIAPFLNFLLVGNANWGFMGVLTLELVVFTYFVSLFLPTQAKYFSAILAIVLAKFISAISISVFHLIPVQGLDYFQNALINGIPGIIILTLITLLVLKFQANAEHQN